MKKFSAIPLSALFLLVCISVQAQSTRPADPMARPRSVLAAKGNASRPQSQSQWPQAPARTDSSAKSDARDDSTSSTRWTPSKIRTRIGEAERMFKSRPQPTALTAPPDYVTVAAALSDNSQLHLIRLSKEDFLTKGTELSLTTSQGLAVQLRVVRANGVNTAVTIFDNRGRSLAPLVVEFPIEKFGRFREMAYYTSAHPALLSPDLTKAGQLYVNSMVDLAAKRLRDRGVPIAQNILDVAKRLCIVEHVDHDRFRNENRAALFDEIYSLYALNDLETYRFSVSSAGAGGMVQMIPWTYRLMRERHPGVGLNPDFVAGMRNHGNALEAMLLYMRDTWDDLLASDDVQYAISSKIATVPDLMAAGYNSNAAKLPGYIRRGGPAWRTLIPRETQTYLQIYQSFDSAIRTKQNHPRAKRN